MTVAKLTFWSVAIWLSVPKIVALLGSEALGPCVEETWARAEARRSRDQSLNHRWMFRFASSGFASTFSASTFFASYSISSGTTRWRWRDLHQISRSKMTKKLNKIFNSSPKNSFFLGGACLNRSNLFLNFCLKIAISVLNFVWQSRIYRLFRGPLAPFRTRPSTLFNYYQMFIVLELSWPRNRN